VVAIFGRNTARQRLRRAARESVKIPAFNSSVDCTPWVTGGLWPAELSTVTVDTAPLVKHLKADLQRIVDTANEELKRVRRAGLPDPIRQAEEARVINEARSFAGRRVESTVRHLHNRKPKLLPDYRPIKGVDDAEKTRRFHVTQARPDANQPTDGFASQSLKRPQSGRPQAPPVDQLGRGEPPTEVVEQVRPEITESLKRPESGRPQAPPVDQLGRGEPPTDVVEQVRPEITESLKRPESGRPQAPPVDQLGRGEPPTEVVEQVRPEITEPETSKPIQPVDSDDTQVLAEIAEVLRDIAPLAETPAGPHVKPEPVAHPPEPPPLQLPTRVDGAESTRNQLAAKESESQRERLERLLKFVARQEPGLRWAVGDREDGTTLLVTDLAHGWIPPGLRLPADVRLLEPARRGGTAAGLLGATTMSATYTPGDPLGWATDLDVTETSSDPRELPVVDDLGWALGQATHWRDGLPRMVNTLAKAGSGGTGIVDAEIDILRVYVDTSRYQLLAQYPDVDDGLLLNCLLLATTEAMVLKNSVDANYHFAWFQMLNAPQAGSWVAGSR